jgi:hypothetical protein
VLAWAVQLANQFSASIDVLDLRESFLAMPFVAHIHAAATRDVWPAFERPVTAPRYASRTAP